MTDAATECALCASRDDSALWRDARVRVVDAGEADYPGFLRVVWQAHVPEMTDLAPDDREHCLRLVMAVEQALRDTVQPHKVNLASLGNQVPHLHWHVIPRFTDDAHFPDPVWAARRRTGVAHPFDAARFRSRLLDLLSEAPQ